MGNTNKSQHTPGPWRVTQPWAGFSSLTGANGGLIFGLAAGCDDEKQSDEVCEANARLIAAAPDLLCALEVVLAAVNVRIDDSRIAVFDRARRVIANAKGQVK